MVNKTFGLLFYLKKSKQYETGPFPIYLRLTVDGRRAEVAAKRRCEDLGRWNTAAGRMTGSKEATKILNHIWIFCKAKSMRRTKICCRTGR